VFNLQAVYFGTDNKIYLIPLRFINNNHFEILFPLDFINPIQKINFKEKILKDNIIEMKNNNSKIISNSITSFFKNEYVVYLYK